MISIIIKAKINEIFLESFKNIYGFRQEEPFHNFYDKKLSSKRFSSTLFLHLVMQSQRWELLLIIIADKHFELINFNLRDFVIIICTHSMMDVNKHSQNLLWSFLSFQKYFCFYFIPRIFLLYACIQMNEISF